MTVVELIKLLATAPGDSIVFIDTRQEEDEAIEDVLIGTGTLKGFVYFKGGRREPEGVSDDANKR